MSGALRVCCAIGGSEEADKRLLVVPSNRVGTREKKKPGAEIWCGRQADTSEPSNPRGVRRSAGTTNHCQWRCLKRPHLRAATTTRARTVPWLPSAEGTPGRR